MTGAASPDVIVVGGGPAGSVLAWALAQRGIRATVLERGTFPREKVCGDYIVPSGLRILKAMGALANLDGPDRTPITRSRIYMDSTVAFEGAMPYYEPVHGMPPHAAIIPRHELDTELLARAAAAGATVLQGCSVTSVRQDAGRMQVEFRRNGSTATLSAPLVIGADGVESTVAKSLGMKRNDRRHISVFRRAYVDGIDIDPREVTVWFDAEIYPGYGWMFPLGDGRANVGVGILSEACHRHDLSVPKAFIAAIERLRSRVPGCSGARIASHPMGGVVKSYGGIGRNSFHGGLLIGDAGCFVDPITGEGITQGMESALIAAETVAEALALGRFDSATLSRFDSNARAYFDPSMCWLELCATFLRNRHLRDFSQRLLLRGLRQADRDPAFAHATGAAFGGLDMQPLAIAGQIGAATLRSLGGVVPHMLVDLLFRRFGSSDGLIGDITALRRGWTASHRDDPEWHRHWVADTMRAVTHIDPGSLTGQNQRLRGRLPPQDGSTNSLRL